MAKAKATKAPAKNKKPSTHVYVVKYANTEMHPDDVYQVVGIFGTTEAAAEAIKRQVAGHFFDDEDPFEKGINDFNLKGKKSPYWNDGFYYYWTTKEVVE